jgi:alpha-beta hydrolase superfamily lysophospholipase
LTTKSVGGATFSFSPSWVGVYPFSGDFDPLHRELHSLQPVIDRYREAGLDVMVDLYPFARHEILNEINRAEVVAALLRWIDRVVTRG